MTAIKPKVEDIRKEFSRAYHANEFQIDARGNKVVEIIAADFIADEPTIFAPVNEEYVKAEIAWYEKCSLNINDIYGKLREPPKAWKLAADQYGNINSNYGYLVFSKKYFDQYHHVYCELNKNPESRRATMIYTRPSIWEEFDQGGKSDFICTNAVTYYIRQGKIHCVVQMRSNDVVFGYRNDRAWQMYLLHGLAGSLNVKTGIVYWQVQNLHVYEQHFKYINDYINEH